LDPLTDGRLAEIRRARSGGKAVRIHDRYERGELIESHSRLGRHAVPVYPLRRHCCLPIEDPSSPQQEMSHMNTTRNGKQEMAVSLGELEWQDMHPGSPVKFSVLWGDHKTGPFGMLLKQPGGGYEAGMHAHASDYHAVLVQGTWIHTVEGAAGTPKELTPGSYVFQPAGQFHNEKFLGPDDCIVYIHQFGAADFIPFTGARAAEKK
jgi:mannose-6-phosphate isomerase-like protein (cupin superfamily)